jgi:hypothetical protein
LGDNKLVRARTGDWTYSAVLQYKSSPPIQAPSIQNGLPRNWNSTSARFRPSWAAVVMKIECPGI